jgi:glycosyltransferase involved in cell wall biosynthesis
MPSLSEGLPMVAVEALTHGLAIVGSRIGGLADVACEVDKSGAGGNARLYDLAEGTGGLAAAMKPFLLDPQILMAARRASLEKASSFDLNHALDDYEAVLKQASR